MSNWPDSEIDQKVFIEGLNDRLVKLRHAVKPIVVHKFIEPTQEDWEQAWSRDSGYYPPIPPSVKLLWYDLSSGTMRQYATCHNLSNGLDSDGTVYPVRSDYENDGDYFRFMGNLHHNGRMQSAFFRGNDAARSLYLNPKLWSQKGLRRIIIEYCLAQTGGTLQMWMSNQNTEAKNHFQQAYRQYLYDENTSMFRGTAEGIAATATVTKGLEQALNSVSFASRTLPDIGQIIIDPAIMEEISPRIFAPKIAIMGFYVEDETDPSTAGFSMSTATWEIAESPQEIKLGISAGTISEHDEKLRERGWIYGLFNKRQEQEMREF